MLTIRKMKAKIEESKDVIISSELGGSDGDDTHTHAHKTLYLSIIKKMKTSTH